MKQSVSLDAYAYNVLDIKEGGMGRVWLLQQAKAYPFDPIYRRQIAVKTFNSDCDSTQIESELNSWVLMDCPFILPLRKIGHLDFVTDSFSDLQKQRGI